MKNLKKDYTEHSLNKKTKALVNELNLKIKKNSGVENPPVKFDFYVDNEGIGGIGISIAYSEGLYGCDHGIETEEMGKTKKSDISKLVIGLCNQIIDELQQYKITQ